MFIKLNALFFHCQELSITLRMLLYGMDTWTLKQAQLKKLESFEMWVYCRTLKISWVDRVTNEEVIGRMKAENEFILNIKK